MHKQRLAYTWVQIRFVILYAYEFQADTLAISFVCEFCPRLYCMGEITDLNIGVNIDVRFYDFVAKLQILTSTVTTTVPKVQILTEIPMSEFVT